MNRIEGMVVGQRYHHDQRDYQTAQSEAAKYALLKIEERIGRAKADAEATLNRIFTEVPTDAFVKSQAIHFALDEEAATPDLILEAGDHRWSLHPNAQRQVFETAFKRLPAYANAVLEEGTKAERLELLKMLDTHFHAKGERSKHLTRSKELRMLGFLSDRYRIIDSAPTAEAFVMACGYLGMVPLEGTVTDTRSYLKFIMPRIFEPVPNEIMAFGLTWQNSDYGNGAHSVAAFMYRAWCTNQAMMDNLLREVHLGKRLPDGIEYSERTRRLDAETSVSAIQDVVKSALGPDSVNALCAKIEKAADEKMTWKQLSARLGSELNKTEKEAVKTAFEGADVEMLPAGGQTRWRASNAVSFIANSIEDADRRAQAQRLAGELAA